MSAPQGLGIEKSIRFKDFVYVGSPINAARMFNAYMSDELILLDIVATKERRTARPEILEQIADEVSMPLVVGGGIRTIGDVPPLMEAGADRIAINTGAWENKKLITQIADRYGRQCVVVSIDAKRHPDGKYEVVTHAGHQPIGVDPADWAKEAASLGAGEILINSIDQDGTLEGYDVELFRQVTSEVDIPVIGMGGARDLADMKRAVDVGGVSAVAAGGMFCFGGRGERFLFTIRRMRNFARKWGRISFGRAFRSIRGTSCLNFALPRSRRRGLGGQAMLVTEEWIS